MDRNDALALEYQTIYGTARWNHNVADIVNNPNASSIVRVFGPGLFEQISDLPYAESRSFLDNRPDPVLIAALKKGVTVREASISLRPEGAPS